jgi:hypothetical protein
MLESVLDVSERLPLALCHVLQESSNVFKTSHVRLVPCRIPQPVLARYVGPKPDERLNRRQVTLR